MHAKPTKLSGPHQGAISSAGEHCLHTAGVTGSIPVSPTILLRKIDRFATHYRLESLQYGKSLGTRGRNATPGPRLPSLCSHRRSKKAKRLVERRFRVIRQKVGSNAHTRRRVHENGRCEVSSPPTAPNAFSPYVPPPRTSSISDAITSAQTSIERFAVVPLRPGNGLRPYGSARSHYALRPGQLT